jgi:preprotein translocase subunit SecD
VYRGRAQFRAPAAVANTPSGRRTAKSRGEAERRQTIAERKQAQMAGGDPAKTTTTVADKPGTPGKEGDD